MVRIKLKGNFATELQDEGLTSDQADPAKRLVRVNLIFQNLDTLADGSVRPNGTYYGTDVVLDYVARKGKRGVGVKR